MGLCSGWSEGRYSPSGSRTTRVSDATSTIQDQNALYPTRVISLMNTRTDDQSSYAGVILVSEARENFARRIGHTSGG